MCCEFAVAAEAVAEQLERDAIWHRGRCSWVGAAPVRKDPWRVDYQALGPDVYGGTAGVGLYLAHLGRRGAAIGALRHAVARAGARNGLHAGVLGIAWAAVEVGTLLGEEQLVAAGRALATTTVTPGRCPDVVTGTAGELLGRLALGSVDLAVGCGEALLASAVRGAHGWSWRTPGQRYVRPLCGLAHGASGIGWALLELFAATGDARFRAAGEAAFAYERSWLDDESGAWPDHRLPGYVRGRPHRVASPALGTWCHGEAGIALARLRARELLGEDVDGPALEHAVATTRRHVSAALEQELTDVSLCHGLAGGADALLHAGDTVTARAVGQAILEHYPSRAWPGAEGTSVVPGLFRGMVGTGWFLLRLHDSNIPSPLVVPITVDNASGVA
jgi:lantibiotic modifying enzyme